MTQLCFYHVKLITIIIGYSHLRNPCWRWLPHLGSLLMFIRVVANWFAIVGNFDRYTKRSLFIYITIPETFSLIFPRQLKPYCLPCNSWYLMFLWLYFLLLRFPTWKDKFFVFFCRLCSLFFIFFCGLGRQFHIFIFGILCSAIIPLRLLHFCQLLEGCSFFPLIVKDSRKLLPSLSSYRIT